MVPTNKLYDNVFVQNSKKNNVKFNFDELRDKSNMQ
jgi:hypothetical protein